jgi:hypothetical protein
MNKYSVTWNADIEAMDDVTMRSIAMDVVECATPETVNDIFMEHEGSLINRLVAVHIVNVETGETVAIPVDEVYEA